MSSAVLNDVFKQVEKSIRFQRALGMSALVCSNEGFRRSRKWLIISTISVSGNLIIFFYTHYFIRKSLMDISKGYSYLKSAYSLVLICCIVVSCSLSNRNVHLLNCSLARMRAVDLEMISIGKELPAVKSSFFMALIFWLLSVAYFLKSSTMPTFTDWLQLLILYTPYLLILSFEDNIERVGSMLRLRFTAIKQHLVEYLRIESKKAVPFIEKLVLCHHHLSTSSKDVDEYFSVQVISLLAVFFLATFCEIYAVSIMYTEEMAYKELLMAEKVIWIIVMIAVMARICHQFAAISTESKLRLHIAMNREVIFTAHGFFKLDHSLLHSIIASSTTYLVILLQLCKKSSAFGSQSTNNKPTE